MASRQQEVWYKHSSMNAPPAYCEGGWVGIVVSLSCLSPGTGTGLTVRRVRRAI